MCDPPKLTYTKMTADMSQPGFSIKWLVSAMLERFSSVAVAGAAGEGGMGAYGV